MVSPLSSVTDFIPFTSVTSLLLPSICTTAWWKTEAFMLLLETTSTPACCPSPATAGGDCRATWAAHLKRLQTAPAPSGQLSLSNEINQIYKTAKPISVYLSCPAIRCVHLPLSCWCTEAKSLLVTLSKRVYAKGSAEMLEIVTQLVELSEPHSGAFLWWSSLLLSKIPAIPSSEAEMRGRCCLEHSMNHWKLMSRKGSTQVQGW